MWDKPCGGCASASIGTPRTRVPPNAGDSSASCNESTWVFGVVCVMSHAVRWRTWLDSDKL